jgi:hypothetical protein
VTYWLNVTLSADASHARGEISATRLPFLSYSYLVTMSRGVVPPTNGCTMRTRSSRWLNS